MKGRNGEARERGTSGKWEESGISTRKNAKKWLTRKDREFGKVRTW